MDTTQQPSLISVALLGPPEVTVGAQVSPPATDAALWLLALLASSAQPVAREEILELLYPDAEEAAARNRLRQMLHRVRARPWGAGVVATTGDVQWRASSDVRTFRDACAAGRWAEALEVYRGPLLGSLRPAELPAFEAWLDLERDDLHQLWIDAALCHAEELEGRGQPGAARSWLDRVMTVSPYHEEAVQASLRCAARLNDVPGAAAVYDRFRTQLRRELGLAPAEATTALYEAVRAGHGVAAEAVMAGAGRSSIIGRQEELDVLLARMTDPACRLLTVTGPGGAGKTRVALELLHRSGPRPGGVHFVPLEAATTVPEVVSALATALGLAAGGAESPEAQVIAALQAGASLLALDNLEHLLGGEARAGVLALLTRMLAAAPGAQLIATSRIRLGLQDEWVTLLGGLDLPAAPTLDAAAQSGAVRLFLERARRAQPTLALTPQTLPALLTVVDATGGLPLALELTAGWLGALTLDDVADELRRGLDDVGSEAPDRPARHRSLRAAFDHSWALLPHGAQVVLARLSVCRSGLDLGAARAVGGSGLPTLLVLGDHSLLARDRSGRYALHAAIREFAAARLRALPAELAAATAAHAAYYAGLARDAAPQLHGPEQQAWLSRLQLEHDNLRAAMAHLLTAGDAAGALGLAADLQWFWYVRGHHREGYANLTAALALPGGPGPLRVRALSAAGGLARDLGQYEDARAHLDGALALARTLGLGTLEAHAHHGLALLDRELGQLNNARAHLAAAEALQRAGQDVWGLATTLNDLGVAWALQGEMTRAGALFQESLDLKQRIGDRQGVAYALANLGNVSDTLADFQRLTEQSLEIKRDLGDRQGVANSLFNLADLHVNAGELEVARTQLTEALQLFAQIGRHRGTVAALMEFAKLTAAEGDDRQCVLLAGAADALARAAGVTVQGVNISTVLEHARQRCGADADAVYLRGQLLPLAEAIQQAITPSRTTLTAT
ncbi:putative ATPase [Deinococcus metalli]|uniref:Putative ATPase n=1 Tax=Deinococcus metalli TaxID=1141878 RepID=A0A7W8KH04_9DEIO|nr:BTAD domain-containing putative transcriptional regulator [Deinococcus metalli]MBB5376831.1 putative ATPase [Deinococcus metalli]GHF45682.1 transcriptional activator [Deinococcus metalli]